MPLTSQNLSGWKPVQLPSRIPLHGRHVKLEPLDAELHSTALWTAVQGHNEVWTYLADGPYASEADLRRALEEKQAGSSAVFFAILTKSNNCTEGYASYMRMDPANGVIEVGNILLAPSLQRTIAATEAMYLMCPPRIRGSWVPPLRVEVQRRQRALASRCLAPGIHF